jgi:hypothetical protein
MIPKWAVLLRRYRNEGHFGLTPSFLIGAMRRPVGAMAAEDVSLYELRSMLESMRNHTVGTPVRILKCYLLEQPVAALDDRISSDEEPILPISASEPRLFVARRYLSNGSRDLDGVLIALWNTFRQPMNDGRFSYRVDEEKFDMFNAADLALIRRSFAADA